MKIVSLFALLLISAVACAAEDLADADIRSQLNDAIAASQHRDCARAAQIFESLSNRGVLSARYDLGVMYYETSPNARGCPSDSTTGVFLIMSAAKGGLPEAAAYLKKISPIDPNDVRAGFNEADSLYSQEHYKEANAIWEQLAEVGVAEAQYKLGLSYAYGRGVPHDDNAATKWITLAANQGYYEAVQRLKIIANPPPSHAQACQGMADSRKRILNSPQFSVAAKSEMSEKYSDAMQKSGCN